MIMSSLFKKNIFVIHVVALTVINLMIVRKFNIIKRCFIIENIIQKNILKNMKNNENFDRIKVIELFYKIIDYQDYT